ncbi:MAG: glycosyltransferase family 9 protein [Chloroflexi bacterium]|nr:glycosyltransferase family 9 protein [Chloroflexota bacterium]
MTLPALAALRARFPDAPLTLVGNRAVAPLVQLAELADRWIDFDAVAVASLFVPEGAECFGARAGLRSEGAHRAPLQAAVAWCGDPDGVLRRNLEQLGAEHVLVAPSRPSVGAHGVRPRIHMADHLVGTLQSLGVGPRDASAPIRLDVPATLAANAHARLTRLGLAGRRWVAVHPGSGSASKNWPVERLATLVERLPSTVGASALVLAGPADEDAVAQLLARLAPPPLLVRDLPLPELAAALQHADAYVGNDSGPTHLAAMLGRPTLALFGPTDPALWAPRGPRVRVLHHPPLADLAPDVVLNALAGLLRQP